MTEKKPKKNSKPEFPFAEKFLKNYIYVLSFPADTIQPIIVERLFEMITLTLNKANVKYDYGFCILPNPIDYPVEENISDIFISYNSEYLIDEKSLVSIVRTELMQSMK